MRRHMFNAKIHRATVTQADLHYEGSLTIDRNLLDAAGILPYEEVQVWNVTSGSRLATYAIEGERGTGVICVNGAAAHHASIGDLIIIATFVELDDAEARLHQPTAVFVDAGNRLIEARAEVPGPVLVS